MREIKISHHHAALGLAVRAQEQHVGGLLEQQRTAFLEIEIDQADRGLRHGEAKRLMVFDVVRVNRERPRARWRRLNRPEVFLEVDVSKVLAADHRRQQEFDADGGHHLDSVIDRDDLLLLDLGHDLIGQEQEVLDNGRVGKLFEFLDVFLAEARRTELLLDHLEDALADLVDGFCRGMDVVVGKRHPGRGHVQMVLQEGVCQHDGRTSSWLSRATPRPAAQPDW